MDTFTKYEIIGRDKFQIFYDNILKPLGYNQIAYSQKRFECYDVVVLNKSTKTIMIVEIKCRAKKYYDFKDVFLETKKAASLLDKRLDFLFKQPNWNIKTLYFMCYDRMNVARYILPDSITLFRQKIEKRLCPVTTAGISNKMIDKDCYIFTDYKEIDITKQNIF